MLLSEKTHCANHWQAMCLLSLLQQHPHGGEVRALAPAAWWEQVSPGPCVPQEVRGLGMTQAPKL